MPTGAHTRPRRARSPAIRAELAHDEKGAPLTARSDKHQLRPCTELCPHPAGSAIPVMGACEYEAFRADIEERGIRVPLEVTLDGLVLDGRQRLRAACELGLEAVPVRVVEVEEHLSYMLLAALRRRHLSASQRAALALELEAIGEQGKRAKERRQANLRRGQVSPEVATLPPREGKTRSAAASIAGVSERTVQDVLTVRQGDPALFKEVQAGTIAAALAARRVRRERRAGEIAPPPPLPQGPFDVLYADPPWQLGNPDGAYAPENHYPTLPFEEIASLQVPVTENAVLFLWSVNALLPQALAVIDAWGFHYKTNLVWVKPSIGLGQWVRNRHELLLLARKGHHPPPEPEERPDSVIEARRGSHSEKPACVYELIERAYPRAAKLELFARGKPRPGWAAWGNEVEAA